MVRTARIVGAVVLGVISAVSARTLYQRVKTESVPYTTVATVGDAELRRYPETIQVETTATDDREAFGRLFRYISGENDAAETVSMTAPVEVEGRAPATPPRRTLARSLPMTAPVERERSDDSDTVRMAFYLPPEFTVESAPRPTNEHVDLSVVPERTLAVRRFRWRPTDDRIAGESERLLETLETASVPITSAPFYLGYDAPWTLPFLRRNEVAVEADAEDRP